MLVLFPPFCNRSLYRVHSAYDVRQRVKIEFEEKGGGLIVLSGLECEIQERYELPPPIDTNKVSLHVQIKTRNAKRRARTNKYKHSACMSKFLNRRLFLASPSLFL